MHICTYKHTKVNSYIHTYIHQVGHNTDGQLGQQAASMRTDSRQTDIRQTDSPRTGGDERRGNRDEEELDEERPKAFSLRNMSSHGVRIATIDNFQGEENKIIIVSLVRSNPKNVPGFLKVQNRVNVMLSRAKHGMYLIGNRQTVSMSLP